MNIVQGDSGYNLSFTLVDSSNNAINLTSATLAIKVQQVGQDTVKFTGSMVVDSATLGTCHYIVQATDFDQEGRYYAEIQVTYGTGELLTYSNLVIIAAPKLPRA